jgi:DNA-binding IclR family transcriptional regulator
MESSEPKLILSIKKALDILDILAFQDMDGQGMSLSFLSQEVRIKPNTLHGILKTLVFCGYVEQDEHAVYHIGNRLRQIGIINRFRMMPMTSRKLDDALKQLSTTVGESVSFYVLEEGERINYTNIQSQNIIKVDYTMLEKNSIYDYPSGKILVAYAEEEQLQQILKKHGYPGSHWDGIRTREQLNSAIAEVRQKGYLERIKDVASFAGPVFSPDGSLLGTVGVYLPAYRLTDEKRDLILEQLRIFSALFQES